MKKKKENLSIYVALLRGINVGGNSLVRMSDLKALFEKAGFERVRTYIASGNVIFSAKETEPRKLEVLVEKFLAAKYPFAPKVVVHSFDEMERVIDGIPSGWEKGTERKYNVIFLKASVDSKKILEGLGPKKEIEEVHYFPGVLYWSVLTSDLARTSMVKLSANKIYQEVTVRNLNTTEKLFELMKEIGVNPEES